MRTTERHHLKDNELALALGQAQGWAAANQKTISAALVAILVVGGAIAGYAAWRNSVDNDAREMLAGAMVIQEARVMPPAPPAGTTNDPSAPGGQMPGTYPTEKARLEAALPKFQAAADAFPSSDSGLTARYYAAMNLVALGRFDEGIKQFEQVTAGGAGVIQRMARLGKADAQLRAGQYEPAIATLKEVAEQTNSPLPTDAVLMELARAYKLAGKNEDAKKTLTQVVEKHAESPFVSDAKAELAKM